MISMTGFGHGEHRDERVQMVLEVRSYNNGSSSSASTFRTA